MLNCKQVIELASTNLDTPLPWRKRWQYQLHLLICKTCQSYTRQIRFIQQAGQSMDQRWQNIKLSEDARQRLLKILRQSRE